MSASEPHLTAAPHAAAEDHLAPRHFAATHGIGELLDGEHILAIAGDGAIGRVVPKFFAQIGIRLEDGPAGTDDVLHRRPLASRCAIGVIAIRGGLGVPDPFAGGEVDADPALRRAHQHPAAHGQRLHRGQGRHVTIDAVLPCGDDRPLGFLLRRNLRAPTSAQQRHSAGTRGVAGRVAAINGPMHGLIAFRRRLRADIRVQPGQCLILVAEQRHRFSSDPQAGVRRALFQIRKDRLSSIGHAGRQPTTCEQYGERRFVILGGRGLAQSLKAKCGRKRFIVIQLESTGQQSRFVSGFGVRIASRHFRDGGQVARGQRVGEHPLRFCAEQQFISVQPGRRLLGDESPRFRLQPAMNGFAFFQLIEEVLGRFENALQLGKRFAEPAILQEFPRAIDVDLDVVIGAFEDLLPILVGSGGAGWISPDAELYGYRLGPDRRGGADHQGQHDAANRPSWARNLELLRHAGSLLFGKAAAAGCCAAAEQAPRSGRD